MISVDRTLLGKLGDMHGKKRLLLIAMGIFLVGTVAAVALFLAGLARDGRLLGEADAGCSPCPSVRQLLDRRLAVLKADPDSRYYQSLRRWLCAEMRAAQSPASGRLAAPSRLSVP